MATDYSKRYGNPEVWAKKSFVVRRSVGFACCYPGCNVVDFRNLKRTHKKAHDSLLIDLSGGNLVDGKVEAHHASYLGTVPGEHLFPLCSLHHSRKPKGAHHPLNWHKPRGLEVMGAHQKPHYYVLLVKGWREKREWWSGVYREVYGAN
jgi:hypothetical protein